ncbi:cob(I)yrinic acid a,c-diamide adenosyltransferase [Desulfonatronum thiosulfatophilum]|uniref:corrinoid adenosyltransferase n=1 Tax=Desulfonatronum thiosulfatophilum TaxID=617002 RepID=A0A1G6AGU6_9BACT|nr:cob(I)yrinic acid a,c-diamide adenosyltransferase [Desulfonatronum thiosulfatophilum]SDB07625.1 cob(I)yrinic acid a,c-diamide adenosyltransferase [Desulfonatronum thiosulfatophilum]
MIVVYTGDGKGKTSAAMGQIMRAMGHGMRVACAQFLKRGGVAGEQVVLARMLGEDYHVGGLGFMRDQRDFQRHRDAARVTLKWAADRLAEQVQVLVLDELLYTLGAGLIEQEEVQSLLDAARSRNVHLVLTGRGLPGWLRDQADLVTELVVQKHPYNQGQAALRGIDF